MRAVALAGFGAVGQELARRLLAGDVPGVHLAAVTARDLVRARERARALDPELPVVPLAELARHAELVVECATAAAFPEIARTVLSAGGTLIAVSVAGILDVPEAFELARRHHGRLHVASGALPGLDIVRALRERGIDEITLTSRIRASALSAEPWIRSRGFDFTQPPTEPVTVFSGTAMEAAGAFPRHFNVAIALSLAGVGFERTRVVIVADPDIPGPVHRVEVRARDADLTLESRNRASENPRTARIVAPSLLAALRSYVDPVRVGT